MGKRTEKTGRCRCVFWRDVLLVCLFVLVCRVCTARAAGFQVDMPETLVPYGVNQIVMNAPEAGEVELTLSDPYASYVRVVYPVRAGENRVDFDGLTATKQRIGSPGQSLQFSAVFRGEKGREETDEGSLSVGKSRQALLFALPSGSVLYRGGESDWFVEFETTRYEAGNQIRMEVVDAEGKKVFQRSIPVRRDTPFLYRWDGETAKVLPAGDYELRFFCPENPAYVSGFALTVSDGTEEKVPVSVTGPVLAERGMSEDEIWAIMQKPSVVVDIGELSHQRVYTEKKKDSRSLGTLHGQSQGVEVHSMDGEWAYITAFRHEDGARITGYVPVSRLKTVRPNPIYGLLIDKETQTMQVFQEGHVIAVLPVSTGLVAREKLIRETAAGAFLTLRHLEDFSDGGYHYTLPIRYDGGNLLHSVGYKAQGRMRDFTGQTDTLGLKASHGCVRIPVTEDLLQEESVNIWYLWTHLPYHTRVMILDDSEIRERQAQTVKSGGRIVQNLSAEARAVLGKSTVGTVSVKQEKQEETWDFGDDFWGDDLLPDLPTETEELVLTFGGDVVLGTRESWMNQEDALPAYLKSRGMDWPFSQLQEVFLTDDLTTVNLECVLKADAGGEKTSRMFRFRGLPGYTDALKQGSIEHVNIANNHYVDYGEKGKKTTREALTAAGIPYSGYGYTYIFEKRGFKVGFAGIRETIYKQNRSQIREDIAHLREQGCDVVICTCHWGEEYNPRHNDLQMEMAMFIADAGADIIIGGHPHVVQGISEVQGNPVLWSLGNLMFGGTIELTTFDALLARITLQFEDMTYRGCEISLIPVLTSGEAAEGKNDYCPELASGADAERILQLVQDDSGMELQETMWFPDRH